MRVARRDILPTLKPMTLEVAGSHRLAPSTLA
jgi:hypothetical protein